jgi:DNA-binding NarL/FixJ family response regulator
MALADGGEDAQLAALAIFEQLGAGPMAAVVRRDLRTKGVRGISRGPRTATKRNPAALTARELEVLVLVAEGLQNAEIADRLFVSPKTVDHHISAILSKLNARTRAEAVAAAYRLGVAARSDD